MSECTWIYVYVGACVYVLSLVPLISLVYVVTMYGVACRCGNMGGKLSTGDDILLEKKY